MNLELHYEAYPTMEINIDRTVTGAAWFELSSNGVVTGCLGQHVIENVQATDLQPPQYRNRHDHDDKRSVRAFSGRWTATAAGFDLQLTVSSWNSCTLAPAATFDPQITLHCAAATQFGTAGSTNPMSDPHGGSMLLGRAPGVIVKVDQNTHTEIPTITTTIGATSLTEADFVAPRRHR